MNIFHQPISELIWESKYRYILHGKIKDKTIEDTWQRVSQAVAKAELSPLRSEWQKKFYTILDNFQFLPGGRILTGAGTKHQVTLFNCFVMPIWQDSLSGIFDALKEAALTLQQGGGVGYDFSTLRPEGALIKKTDAASSGPLSFMRIWDAMCSTMSSTGARRGAMMGILRCDHPDIEKFIRAKLNPNEFRHFNLSVLVTDEFMRAVKNDEQWQLVFPIGKNEVADSNCVYRRWSGNADLVPCHIVNTISAKQLWEMILRSAYDFAEPGVLFEDTINRLNNLYYAEWISATNPCGEIPLPPYGACNLGAINLTQCVIEPFSPQAKIDFKKIENIAAIATRFLDNVVDVSHYPLRAQQQYVFSTRRIGLGFTGLADMFVMLGVRYGSDESLSLASQVMKRISDVTWETSAELAKEKGSFSLYQPDKYLQGEYVKQLPQALQNTIEKNGMRNSHHNSIAPTGTISLLANNISNGIEPIFSGEYERAIRVKEGGLSTYHVKNYALQQWQLQHNKDSFPSAWVEVQSLAPEDHLNMQHAVQPYIDNAISKTINLPADFPFESLSDVYTQAFDFELKGCTIFRPNAVTGSVLSLLAADESEVCCKI